MKKPKPPEEVKCPAWMMTFGDFMSLLVTFFVMLIAFSTFEEEKLAYLIGSLKGALGITPPAVEVVLKEYIRAEQIRGRLEEPNWLSVEELSVVVPDLQMALKRFGSPALDHERYVTVAMFEDGMAFIISVKPLFVPGKSGLLPGNEPMLGEIGKFIKAFANEARIIGVVNETSQVLSRTSRTPWGLAVERALAVQDGLMEECGLPSDRFSIGAKVNEAIPGSGHETPHGGPAPISWERHVVGRTPRADVFPDERIEIIMLGKRAFDEMSPEEIIVKDIWD